MTIPVIGAVNMNIPVGKLPADLLDTLLARYVPNDPRVLVGPRVGEDAAVIEMSDRCLVAKSDPITFATDEIGWYAVNVNANDIACCGAVPRWFLATLLLPERETTAELVESMFEQISRACDELSIAWCGGHTEITYGLDRPIVSGHMLGEVDKDRLVTSSGAEVGDTLILTKGVAVEGTALIAREKRDELMSVVSSEALHRMANFLHDPGISVVRDARIACETGGVHAMHDPTEGGIATGFWELSAAADVGLLIDEQQLPILPECLSVCRQFGLDPLGLIASGSLLISAASESADAIIERLREHDIVAARVGEVVSADQGCMLRGVDGTSRPLPTFERDEIARLFT